MLCALPLTRDREPAARVAGVPGSTPFGYRLNDKYRAIEAEAHAAVAADPAALAAAMTKPTSER